MQQLQTQTPNNELLSFALAIMAANEHDGICNFDTLFSKNVPHIMEKIFFFLDYESYKECLEVSDEWRGLLTSERYKTKGKSVFREGILEDEKKLQIAAGGQGNTNEVRRLLSSGMVDVNCQDHNKWTPLYAAADKGHKEVAQLLIKSGANPNVTNIWGLSALHLAVDRGHAHVTKLLIELGAEPNVADSLGRTPLHWAARNGNEYVVQLLIQSRAELNVCDEDGGTPLHEAASWRRKEVAQLLIESGADMNKADNVGNIPSQYLKD